MKRIHVIDMPRAADEMLLHWIVLRRQGVMPAAIARIFGSSRSTVKKSMACVIADDIAMSGEVDVRRKYWA